MLRSYVLQASIVPFLAFPLGVSPHVFLFPAVFGFLPGGGTACRSDSIIGQYLNDILDLSVVLGFLAPSDTRPGRSRYLLAPGRMSPFRTHKIVSVAPRDTILLWQYVAFSQQCSVVVTIVFPLLEKGVTLRRLLYV